MLEFGAGKYYVKLINYDKQIIRVIDVNLADERCSLPSQPLDSGIHSNIRCQKLLFHTDIGFVNCSKPMKESTLKEFLH